MLSSENPIDDDDTDLPHRLVAGDVDYKCFEDIEDTTQCHDETESDPNVTYQNHYTPYKYAFSLKLYRKTAQPSYFIS